MVATYAIDFTTFQRGDKRMKHIVKLDRNDILCAIGDYLEKKGYKPSTTSYYPWVTFAMGKINIGNQREPESIETVVGAECSLEL